MTEQTDPKYMKDTAGKMILGIKILFFAVLAISLTGLVFFSSRDRFRPMDRRKPVYIEEWSVEAPDGDRFTAGSTYRSTYSERGSFTMESRLPSYIPEGSSLCFIVGGDVSVYVRGSLRKDFLADRDVILPGGCVKRFYMLVPLEPEDAGGDVKIVRTGTTRGGYVYQDTFVADDASFYSYMITKYGLSFLLGQLLLIFALLTTVTSIVMMVLYRRRIEMLYGALSIAVVSGWLITNSFLYPFLYGHYHIDGIMNYMLCLMMPFCMAIYLDCLQRGRYRKIMAAILLVAGANLIVWPILHFTCTFTFPRALLYIDIFLGAELLTVAGLFVADIIKGHMKDYKYTALGFCGFFVCALAEIVVLNFLPVINGDILMLSGLAFMLILEVVQQIDDLRIVREEGQRAVDLSEAKTRFLASMSHEIRTPINAILGMNEMILRENRDPVISEYAASAKSSGEMLLMLVNDVLDFSKIEAGKMEITNAEFDFSSVLGNTMPILRERADEKGLTLSTVMGKDVPSGLISDEFRIRQILINLINNAIKYTDTGSVTLTVDGTYTSEDTYELWMSIRDTGRGIREEDQKHLFEAFTRADIRKNRSIEGTGLGLAIVKSIVDSMEGSISVKSVYGEGSEFIVTLPVRVTDPAPLTEDHISRSPKSDAGSRCSYSAPDASILVVDDNTSNLRIVSLFLKHAKIVPDLCSSGGKAVELCRKKHYDLMLLDHMMPDPDGIKTLSIIRSDRDSLNRKTPAIVLTANALAGSRREYMDAGFADYLTKPIDATLLEETIRNYLPEDKVLPPAGDASDMTEVSSGASRDQAPEDTAVDRIPEDTAVADPIPEDTTPADLAAAAGGMMPMTFREKMEMIEGMDYDTALAYMGGDEELLKEVASAIASDSGEQIDTMRRAMASEDWESYRLTAHAIKGLMASVGLSALSERAKKHEYAARDMDTGFIASDSEGFFETFEDVCRVFTDP